MAAMQGILANPGRLPYAEVEEGKDAYSRLTARVAIEFADALLAELAKEP